MPDAATAQATLTAVLLFPLLLATANARYNPHSSTTAGPDEVKALPLPLTADLVQADFIYQFRRFTDALYPTREEQEHARAAINEVAQLLEQRMSSYKVDRVHKGGEGVLWCAPD